MIPKECSNASEICCRGLILATRSTLREFNSSLLRPPSQGRAMASKSGSKIEVSIIAITIRRGGERESVKRQ